MTNPLIADKILASLLLDMVKHYKARVQVKHGECYLPQSFTDWARNLYYEKVLPLPERLVCDHCEKAWAPRTAWDLECGSCNALAVDLAEVVWHIVKMRGG